MNERNEKYISYKKWRNSLTNNQIDNIIFNFFNNQVEELLFEYFNKSVKNGVKNS